MSQDRSLPSVRTELLANFAVLAVGALVIAIGSVLLFAGLGDVEHGALYLSLLIIGDVCVFVAFGAYQLRRLILRPLADTVAAAEAIAAGDLARRVPEGRTVEFAALSGSVNRMTDRLLAEQAHLVRAEKLASVGRLAAGVAHEIGNPLGAINGYAHLLRTRIDRGESAAEALDGLERESGRIDRIVRGLLDYARQRRTTPSRVDLNDTVRSVVDLLATQGVLRGTEMRLELDPAAPVLLGARHDVEQIFVNLLLNAVDAMGTAGTLTIHTRRTRAAALSRPAPRRSTDAGEPAAAREPRPRVRAWLDTIDPAIEVVQIIVADSGPGIPEADAERIFDPFYTTKEPGKGTGLGLAIVARIVEGLHGVVWTQPAREGGAAFVLVLPLAPAAAGTPAVPGAAVPALPQAAPRSTGGAVA